MKTILAGLILSLAVYQAQATLDFYDSFNYSPAGAQLSSAGSPSWYLNSLGGVDPKIVAGSLSYPGLNTAAGDNAVVFNGTNATGVSMRQLSQVYTINNASTLYYSLTFKVNTVTTNDWTGSANWLTGSFMLGMSQRTNGNFANGDTAAPLLIRTGDPNNTTGNATGFQGYQLGTGVTQTSPGSRVFDATHTYLPGDTLFLVLSYTFNSGANDDVARLWVNPVPGSLESANTPVVNATGVADVNNNQIFTFFLRNNSVEPSDPYIDDLRVGTTWEDVTPAAVPEPSTGVIIAAGFLGLILFRRFRR